MVWNHRNLCLFDSISPNLVGVLLLAFEVIFFWSLAGAQGISFLPLSLWATCRCSSSLVEAVVLLYTKGANACLEIWMCGCVL